MATWAELEASAPEIADAGRRLLFHPGFGFGYLATVRADGGPRVHPVNPVIAAGRLWVFVVPSPKLDDLRRDGRFALHSTGAADVNDELYLDGRARFGGDAAMRALVEAACHFAVPAHHVLVELDLAHVLWARYAEPPSFPPEYRRWADPGRAGSPASPARGGG
jgi:hypothetical protein